MGPTAPGQHRLPEVPLVVVASMAFLDEDARMAILAQDSDDDMKELTDALTDGQRAKLAEFLATQEAEEARDQESPRR